MQPSLCAPYLYPDIPVFKPGAYSTGMAAALNAAMTAAVASGRNGLKVYEGHQYADGPIVLPNSGFALVGLGRVIPGARGESYGGGVQFTGPYGAATSVLQISGSSPPSTAGATHTLVENIAISGLATNADMLSRTTGPVPLISISNGYKVRLNDVTAATDYGQILRIFNTWDSDFDHCTFYSGGFCDPTVTTDSTTVQGYTGRHFLALETAIARSLGVPAIEIISPNTVGSDNSDNLRWKSLHCESNGTNGVPLLIWGGNGNTFHFDSGCKIEANEGCVPLIALQDQLSFNWNGLLNCGGIGSAPGPVGSLATGTNWRTYGNPGMVLAHSCTSPKISGVVGTVGKIVNGSTPATGSALQAFARFIACNDPQTNLTVSSGLDGLATSASGGARQIFDGCFDVSTARTRCYAYPYLKTVANANTVERTTPNGTTTEA